MTVDLDALEARCVEFQEFYGSVPVAVSALRALVAELRQRRIDNERMVRAVAFVNTAAPLTDEAFRAIKLRWATGPENYQHDADALIAGVLYERARVEATKDLAEQMSTAYDAARTQLATERAEREAAERERDSVVVERQHYFEKYQRTYDQLVTAQRDLAAARALLREALIGAVRCERNGHPWGTDTVAKGRACPCATCTRVAAALGEGGGT